MDTMIYYRDIWSRDAVFLFLPFSLVMFVTGRVTSLETFYVSLINFGFGAFLMCSVLFLLGIVSIVRGSTPYEARKNVNREKLDFSEKFKNVFGTMGLLHFFLPFLPFEEPYLEPGYRRLLGPQYT